MPPNRHQRVTVQLIQKTVVIPWDAQQELLVQLCKNPEGAEAVRAFREVGTSGPVTLTRRDKEIVAEAITAWFERERMDVADMPELWELRNELLNDVE